MAQELLTLRMTEIRGVRGSPGPADELQIRNRRRARDLFELPNLTAQEVSEHQARLGDAEKRVEVRGAEVGVYCNAASAAARQGDGEAGRHDRLAHAPFSSADCPDSRCSSVHRIYLIHCAAPGLRFPDLIHPFSGYVDLCVFMCQVKFDILTFSVQHVRSFDPRVRSFDPRVCKIAEFEAFDLAGSVSKPASGSIAAAPAEQAAK
jgi:hypothetical protein